MLATWGCATFPKPTLDLDFSGATSLDSRITFSRATKAWYFNSAGVLTQADDNVARFDYDPSTLAPRGLLIEEARTNSIRNNTMQGAVAGTPGTVPTNWAVPNPANGLTREVIGTGTTNGISWIDVRYYGTTSSSSSVIIQPEGTTAVTAATGQSWTASAWSAISGGSTANINAVFQRVTGRTAAGSFLEATDTAVTLASTLTRYAASRTMANASTERVTNDIGFSHNSGAAIDITLRIGLPQLELGAFATSVIPTTTTALTRNADIASMTGTNFSSWYSATGGTMFVEGSTQFLPGDSAQFFGLSDGTANNFFSISANNITAVNRIQGTAFSSGASQFSGVNSANGSYIAGATFKTALAFVANDAQLAFNGATVGSNDTSCAVPVVTSMNLGSGYAAGNRPISGYLRRIAYYPTRLPNATLQALTA